MKKWEKKYSRLMIIQNLIDVIFRRFLFWRAREFYSNQNPIYGSLFDYISIEIIISDRFEKKQLEILKEFVLSMFPGEKRLNLVVDVGANIGNHARFFSDFTNLVIAVEAHPETYSLLKLNTNAFPNISALNAGVSDSRGTLYMPRLGHGTGGSSLQEESSDFAIECLTLDEILKNNAVVDLIKIDVEGHELQVLRGCAKILEQRKPIVVFEQQRSEVCDGTTASIEFLKRFGYDSFLYLEKNGEGVKLNSWINRFFAVLLFGDCYRLTERTVTPARYHEMIVALPEKSGYGK